MLASLMCFGKPGCLEQERVFVRAEGPSSTLQATQGVVTQLHIARPQLIGVPFSQAHEAFKHASENMSATQHYQSRAPAAFQSLGWKVHQMVRFQSLAFPPCCERGPAPRFLLLRVAPVPSKLRFFSLRSTGTHTVAPWRRESTRTVTTASLDRPPD